MKIKAYIYNDWTERCSPKGLPFLAPTPEGTLYAATYHEAVLRLMARGYAPVFGGTIEGAEYIGGSIEPSTWATQ